MDQFLAKLTTSRNLLEQGHSHSHNNSSRCGSGGKSDHIPVIE